MTLLGTFLVRSGIVVSVHAFAVDPLRGQYILIYLAFFAIPAYVLWTKSYAHYFDLCHQDESNISRKERWLLLQTAIMLGILLVIVVATLYPLWVEAVWHTKISVGPGYFEQVLAPLTWGLFYAMGAEQLEKDGWGAWRGQVIYVAAACIITSAVVWSMSNAFQQPASVTTWITCLFALWAALPLLSRRIIQLPGKCIAHMTVIGLLLCVVLSKSYEASQMYSIQTGERVAFMGYNWMMDSVWQDKQENYLRQRVKIIKKSASSFSIAWPELRYFPSQESTQTKAYIDRGFWGDWYIAVAKPQEGDTFLLRLYYKPFLCLLWLCGGGLFLCGIRAWYRHKAWVGDDDK